MPTALAAALSFDDPVQAPAMTTYGHGILISAGAVRAGAELPQGVRKLGLRVRRAGHAVAVAPVPADQSPRAPLQSLRSCNQFRCLQIVCASDPSEL